MMAVMMMGTGGAGSGIMLERGSPVQHCIRGPAAGAADIILQEGSQPTRRRSVPTSPSRASAAEGSDDEDDDGSDDGGAQASD